MMNFRRIALVLLITSLLATSCRREKTPFPFQTPTVSSFQVTDYCLRKITITGSNFNPDPSKDQVYFGSTQGIVDSATATHIYARYPAGNISGQIRVISNNREVLSLTPFSFSLPTISSYSPSIAGPGTPITIIGENFAGDMVGDSVFFNGIRATIISSTSTQIIATVPPNATSGSLTVMTHCESANINTPFGFSNKGIVYVSGNSGYCHAIDIASGTLIWKKMTNSPFYAGPSYANGTLYIGSADVNDLANNYMYALDPLTGEQRWKTQAGPFDAIPAITNDRVYIGGFDKKFYSFDASTGAMKWSYTTSEYFRGGGPTVYAGKVYNRNDDGYFYCLDENTGALKWRSMIWAGGNPAASNGIIYTAGSGKFYALNADTGDEIWTRDMTALSGSSPTIVNGVVYIGTENHQVYALDATNGDIIWQKEGSWWIGSAAIVADDVLYIQAGDGVLMAFNIANGDLLWARGLPATFIVGSSPVVAHNMVFSGDNSGTLNAMDAKTGLTIWTYSTGGYPIISSPCVVDATGQVYHGGDSGNQQ